MNLHGIASGVISSVNPMTTAMLSRSVGSTDNPDGTATPSYNPPEAITVQQQAMTQKDLQHMAMLGIQGAFTKFWMDGAVYGAVRGTQSGGDLLVDSKGQTWLVSAVLEIWPDWCSVACTLQVDPVGV